MERVVPAKHMYRKVDVPSKTGLSLDAIYAEYSIRYFNIYDDGGTVI